MTNFKKKKKSDPMHYNAMMHGIGDVITINKKEAIKHFKKASNEVI